MINLVEKALLYRMHFLKSEAKIFELSKKLTSDEARIRSLNYIKKSDNILYIISSFKSEKNKFDCLPHLENEKEKVSVIKTLNDNLKIKSLDFITLEVNVTSVVTSIDDIEKKLLCLKFILSPVIKKFFINALVKNNDIFKDILAIQNDDLKITLMDYLDDNLIKVDILKSFTDEEKKLSCLEFLLEDKYLLMVIDSFSSVELKIKGLSFITDINVVKDMIEKLIPSDEEKLKILEILDTEEYKILIISFIKDDENKLKSLLYLKDDYYKKNVIDIIKKDEYKIMALSLLVNNEVKIEIIINLDNDEDKITLMENIDGCSEMLKSKVIKSLKQEKNILAEISKILDLKNRIDILNTLENTDLVKKYKDNFLFNGKVILNGIILSNRQLDIIKKLYIKNSLILETLDLEMLDDKLISMLGFFTFERLVMYKDIERIILNVKKNESRMKLFCFAFKNLTENFVFIGPLVELIGKKVSYIDEKSARKLSSIIIENENKLSEEDKGAILFLIINSTYLSRINSFQDIRNFEEEPIEKPEYKLKKTYISLHDLKDIYCINFLHKSYDEIERLVEVYADDARELLLRYALRENLSFNEKNEKLALEIIISLKLLVEEDNKDFLKKLIKNKSKKISFDQYIHLFTLEKELQRAYGRELKETLNKKRGKYEEEIKTCETGIHKDEEYTVRNVSGEFTMMVSVMGAFRKTNIPGDMYDRWNTTSHASNHALCFSLISESNFGIAQSGLTISVKDFHIEGMLAAAPYDIFSNNKSNTTCSVRESKYYTAESMKNKTRTGYSEYNMEITDETGDKLQINSIICFDEVNQESIDASIELSKKTGRVIPIELINRRELINVQIEEIKASFLKIKTSSCIEVEEIHKVINKFLNIRSSIRTTCLEDEFLTNENSFFELNNMTKYLTLILEIVEMHMETGELNDGFKVLALIGKEKSFISNSVICKINSLKEKYILQKNDDTLGEIIYFNSNLNEKTNETLLKSSK